MVAALLLLISEEEEQLPEEDGRDAAPPPRCRSKAAGLLMFMSSLPQEEEANVLIWRAMFGKLCADKTNRMRSWLAANGLRSAREARQGRGFMLTQAGSEGTDATSSIDLPWLWRHRGDGGDSDLPG